MSQSSRILLALALGLALGIALAAFAPGAAPDVVAVARPIGSAWLNGLQMTVMPLVFALLVTGVAAAAEAARAGRVAATTIVAVLAVLAFSAVVAALLTPLLLDLFPLPAQSALALRKALGALGPTAPVPALGEFLAGIVPSNVLAAASANSFLSLIVFALVFAFALTRIAPEGRAQLIGFFTAVRDAMLVVIGWVIRIAPIGVFALALMVGATAGTAAFGALAHYVVTVIAVGLTVSLIGFPVALIGGGVPLGRFVRASLPSQAIAISTQSSLASMPAMLRGAERLGVPVATSGVVLPLAVAMMRATGPAMNLAVAIYVAVWFGVPISAPTMLVAVLVATLTSLGSVSLPGQISFISAISPVAATLGAPLAPLGLLVAVETLPDIVRTLGNVIVDLAVTTMIARRAGGGVETRSSGDALLEEAG